ncbi:hypothetical protein SUDANB58_02643 [Streptomyces sp. enrichment culture]|uniref:DUF3224 domain-containing protein n=1 Tax=Streptomyces sp. enrichment culture TaxID=1795815 RepID=UPI003F542B27
MPGTRTTGHFTFADWKEHPVGPDTTGARLAHASATNTFTGGVEAAGTLCEYSIVYLPDGTGTFAGMELLTGRIDGREGAFALEERGTFDADGTVRCVFEVVAGSGTGELTGLRGSGGFTVRPGEKEVAYEFTYARE